MKKILALTLALLMVVSMFAGCTNAGNNGTNPTGTKPNGGETTPPVDPNATYTYNYAMAEFPSNWNYHTYQTATDADILDYITDGFYSFDYNETMDGYSMKDAMAIGDPKDVTAEYVGQFGIEEGDENRAYVITLREDLCWQNGDKITAHDFEESVKRLLNPVAQNYRADTMYAGSVIIHNAEKYLKQGQTAYVDDASCALADLVKQDDGTYATAEGDPVYVAVAYKLAYFNGKNSLADYVGAYGATYFDTSRWEELAAMADENGLVALTDETYEMLKVTITGNANWGEDESYLPNYMVYNHTYPEMDYSEVGWFAKSDYELVFIMDAPLSGFYLKYNLPAPLVHIATYDACTSIVDGVYSNTYCTSAENTMSYGPYKLDSFQLDKQYTLSKNDKYYGLTEGIYQTTNIVVDYIPEAETRLEAFLQGKLDTFGLTIDYMETYQLSDNTYYSTGDSTFAMTFNPDAEALVEKQAAAGENINKTILTLVEFRQAMSFALDRNAFALATSPMNAPGFGLFSGLIVSDPEAGTTYRSTDEAKNVLAEFWGVADEYGDGKLYADIDEAIESITGYNLTKAQELFNAAYDKAIAEGLMDEDDVIQICIGTPNNTSAFYNNGYEFLVNNYTEAVKGTKLEGKLTFTRDHTLGNAFSDALNNNQVDMLFGVGWTGSALDPYGLMQVYVDPNYQYDDSFDYTVIDLTVKINGEDYTTDCASWYNIMNGTPCNVKKADGSVIEYSCGVADNDPASRLAILSALEGAILLNYNFIPIIDDASASLKGMQIQYKTEEYIFGMGFGGLKYYTYHYTDEQWDAYVAENGGTLDYT